MQHRLVCVLHVAHLLSCSAFNELLELVNAGKVVEVALFGKEGCFTHHIVPCALHGLAAPSCALAVIVQRTAYVILTEEVFSRSGLLALGFVLSYPKCLLHLQVLSRAKDAAERARLFKVLVTPPQDVAQLIVGEYGSRVVEAKRVQHIQESLLDSRPEGRVGCLVVHILCKARKILLCGGTLVVALLLHERVYLLPYLVVAALVHVIKELVEVLTEQLTQAVVGYRLMQYCLLHICHTGVVAYDYGYLASSLVVEAFCLLPLAREARAIVRYLHVAEMQLLCQLLRMCGHTFPHVLRVFYLLSCAVSALAYHLRYGVVGKRYLLVCGLSFTFTLEPFATVFAVQSLYGSIVHVGSALIGLLLLLVRQVIPRLTLGCLLGVFAVLELKAPLFQFLSQLWMEGLDGQLHLLSCLLLGYAESCGHLVGHLAVGNNALDLAPA